MAKKPATQTEEEPDDDEVEFTPKQLNIINDTVTAAVTAHVKRAVKPLQEQLVELPNIRESIEQLTKNLTAQPAAQPAKKGAATEEKPKEEDPEKEEMRKRVATLENERKQERIARQHSERDRKLNEVATALGVDKNRLRGATALLREQVKFDKDGNAIMTVKRNGFDEDVDIETGARDFFATDEGKAYIAPSTGGGRGGAGGGRGTSAATVARGGAGSGAAPSNAPAKDTNAAKIEKKQQAGEALMGAVSELLGGGSINVG